MVKQYEYNVVLTEECIDVPLIKRVTLILNHKITPNDQANLEKEYSSLETSGTSLVVTFYKLLKVTGDFTYTVIYQKLEFGKWVTCSQIITQNHKFTSTTAKSDFREFIRFLYPSDSPIAPKEWNIEYTKVLLFQEIPDD